MAKMNWKPAKTGHVVHPEPQPVFRGVFARCRFCSRRFDRPKKRDCHFC